MQHQIINSKDLSFEEKEFISGVWTEAFGEAGEENTETRGFMKGLFFSKGSFRQNSFFGLSSTHLCFLSEKKNRILGIGGVLSLVQSQGYGKCLTTGTKAYILKLKKTTRILREKKCILL